MSASDTRRLAEARARADIARRRFASALQSTRRRIAPQRLKEDALVAVNDKVDETKQTVRQTVRRHPLLTVSAVVGGVAILVWSPARHLALIGARASQIIWMNRALWRTRK